MYVQVAKSLVLGSLFGLKRIWQFFVRVKGLIHLKSSPNIEVVIHKNRLGQK
jgi:hypothetical protein